MSFWTRVQGQPNGAAKVNGPGATTHATRGDGAAQRAESAALLRAAARMWEGSETQSRLIDGALTGATESAQSLRQTASQAESVATSGEELASSANELAASIEEMTVGATSLAASIAETGASIEETSLEAAARFESFDEWWEPFTLGVGPAGDYAQTLDDESRELLRARCQELLPAVPFTLNTWAWAARGLA